MERETDGSRQAIQDALIVVLVVCLWPENALAWGPVAHIDFGSQILSGAVALIPAVRRLIGRHPLDFLYGGLIADAVVAKNLAPRPDHCHRWDAARRLLTDIRPGGDHSRAFALGYLSHLAADVVAHSHYVPERLILYYGVKGIGHLYWESRFDEKLLRESPETKDRWLDIMRRRFPDHDALLAAHVAPTLFSHAVSTHLFRGAMRIQRRGPWRAALKRIDERSRLALSRDEILTWRALAIEMIRRAMDDPFSDELDRFDPTGKAALSSASARRLVLRRHLRRHGQTPELRRMVDLGLSDLPPGRPADED